MQDPAHSLRVDRIKGISLDLDDTLWPFHLALARAEEALHRWLHANAPGTVPVLPDIEALRELRAATHRRRPDLVHDLIGMRHASIREALLLGGEDPSLTPAAYEAFIEARHQVTLFDDALPALAWLSARFPVVAVSNGNADLARVGLDSYFRGALSAAAFGHAKPHPRIFEAAADAIGLPAHEVLHVGDDIELDVDGALAAGMQACWVVRDACSAPMTALPSRTRAAHVVVPDLLHLCDLLGRRGG